MIDVEHNIQDYPKGEKSKYNIYILYIYNGVLLHPITVTNNMIIYVYM